MSRKKTENSRPGIGAKEFAAAVDALRRGNVIVFPTETLYGLGADALDEKAVEKIFNLKGRDPGNPIPVLVSDQDMLPELVSAIPPLAHRLMNRFWPGPLTLVLPARENIPRPLLNATGGIGIRISSEPIATEVVKALGQPVTATSANPSGKEPARTIVAAKDYFRGKINVFLDGGRLKSKTGSTVVEVIGDRIRVIREGEIGRSEIRRLLRGKKILR